MRVSPHTARIAHTAALTVTATGVNISPTVIVAPRIVVVAADDVVAADHVVAVQMMTWTDRFSFILTAGQPGGTPRMGEGIAAPRTATIHR